MSMQADLALCAPVVPDAPIEPITSITPVVIAVNTILQRLRLETRDAHAAIESTLALTEKRLTLGAYRQVIESFYGFYKPVEHAIANAAHAAPMPVWLNLDARRKTVLLEADLKRLNPHAVSAPLLCDMLPPLDKIAQRLGCLYVLEGATLGGVLISRHIRENLGIYPESGGRFFQGYGCATAAMWSDYRAGLLAFATLAPQDEDLIIATARATFETLHRWCENRKKKHER
jgi:heme oxygenase (biliverdin-IX-beta and delta-forming)